MSNTAWLIVGGIIAVVLYQRYQQSLAQPIIPGIQPAGCLPGDPSITYGGKTYCIPQGIIPY